ncbi:hypothetical protein B0H14DRAFT_2377718 [Mycena olivaceomarginata]|nr:hypothetical protein B0H14DRAFT_2377718 [Mycena olivaceomarginata]
MAKEEFTLPQQLDLLPSDMLSLAKMVDFSVPLECPPSSAEQHAQYFSTAASDPANQNAIHHLRRLPSPESKIIRKLATCSCQAWLDGYKSVIYSHLGEGVVTHFPLWVLTYWTAILDFKRDIRGYWVRIFDWIVSRRRHPKKSGTGGAGGGDEPYPQHAAVGLGEATWFVGLGASVQPLSKTTFSSSSATKSTLTQGFYCRREWWSGSCR